MSVITKSGGNAFHGNVFEYARNDRFDARNYFDSLRNADGSKISEGPKSPLKLNQFGGSVGRPDRARTRPSFSAATKAIGWMPA